jgi:hypothetical protein
VGKSAFTTRSLEWLVSWSSRAVAWDFSVHIQTPQWLKGRRAIRSFFIGEVDRDKVVLHGDL